MQEVEFLLLADRLTHNGASRHLTEQDWDLFIAWTKTYHDLAWRLGNDDALLALGRDIHTWLDGDEHWLAALCGCAGGCMAAQSSMYSGLDSLDQHDPGRGPAPRVSYSPFSTPNHSQIWAERVPKRDVPERNVAIRPHCRSIEKPVNATILQKQTFHILLHFLRDLLDSLV